MRILYAILVLFLLLSCTDKEGEKLQESIQEEIKIDAKDSLSTSNVVTVEQYKEIEMQFNKKYVQNLQTLIDDSFEKQLEHFDDEELGFFASYGYMIDYIFKSDQEWEDEMLLKSQKYFGSLNIEQEANNLFESHIEEIKRLRARFIESNNLKNLPQYQNLYLPDRNVNLMPLKKHAEINLVIEIGEEFLRWFIFVTVIALISFLFGLAKPPAWIVTIVLIIISCILSYHNDKELLASLRAQETSITIDYSSLNKTLDINTNRFYEITD
jgi:hypothetical protein